MAARNIILLSDGTGNSSGKLFKTNVWRIYEALNLTSANQIAYYDNGVGTSSFKPLALLGGAFGFGLKRNILGLYMFLCRNYRPGDCIYGFGFSRGAFTIRVLIKFVLSMGLVNDFDSTDDLKRKSRALYRQFRKKQSKFFRLSEAVRWLVYLFLRPLEPKNIKTQAVAGIQFLGLWDTVDAYGLPVEELKTGIDKFIWPLALEDRKLIPKVDKACHALSIDDNAQASIPCCGTRPKRLGRPSIPTKNGSLRSGSPARMPTSAAAIPMTASPMSHCAGWSTRSAGATSSS